MTIRQDTTYRILVIDDEEDVRSSFRRYLTEHDFEVLEAENGQKGLDLFEQEKPDMVLTDLRMPGVDGLEVVAVITKSYPRVPVIIVSGTGNIMDAIEAIRLGAWDYVLKPIENLSVLKHAVDRALERARLLEEKRLYQVHLEEEVARRTEELTGANASLQKEIELRRASEERFRAVYNSVNDAIFIHDINTGAILDVNQKTCEMYGYSMNDIVAADVGALSSGVPPYTQEDAVHKVMAAAAGEPQLFEWHARRKDGSLFWVEVNMRTAMIGGKARVLVTIRDITERRRLEDRLRQSQKMEAVGAMAGGVAHDFNNILSAITGFASLLQMKLKTDASLRQYADQILQSSERAAVLTKTLLSFSRKDKPDMKPLDANAVVSGFQKILARLIGEDIEFSLHALPAELNIQADKGQIEQVLMNLVTNARDAMPKGGKLSVSTERLVFTGEHGDLSAGAYAVISVSDTGVGMDKATQEHIFEPFFTTKEVGKGTGLGLSIVYGIIKNHGGSIHVYSEPGMGTTFKVMLPLLEGTAVTAPEFIEQHALPTGTETILLAEDDAGTRQVTKMLLEECGYTVIEAVDGEDAIRKFREKKDTIQLVLTDLVMPKMNGRVAYEEMNKLRPGVRAVFMSGYTRDIIAQKEILDEGMPFVSKPLIPTELFRGIRAALRKD